MYIIYRSHHLVSLAVSVYSERKQFCNILGTFGFVQNICTETH